jgi:hypothetical protein
LVPKEPLIVGTPFMFDCIIFGTPTLCVEHKMFQNNQLGTLGVPIKFNRFTENIDNQ